MIDGETISIACNSASLKYELLDNFEVKGRKLIDTTGAVDKFIIMYDMAYSLSLLTRISDLDENFTDLDLEDDHLEKLVYGIMNSAGHYRNYTTAKLKRKSVIIMYSSDPTLYTKYARTFAKIEQLLCLFKRTIFISKVDNDANRFIYTHIAYFATLHITNMNAECGRSCKLIYVGSNMSTMMGLMIDRDMIHIKNRYIKYGTDIFFESSLIKLPKDNKYPRDTEMISVMMALIGDRTNLSRLQSIRGKRTITIYNTIMGSINGREIKLDLLLEAIKSFNMSEEDVNTFTYRYKMIDLGFQNQVFDITRKNFTIWEKQLKTKKVYSLNDIVSSVNNTLNVNWLIG